MTRPEARPEIREMFQMRRTTFDKLLGWIGSGLGVALLVVGGLLVWGSAAVHIANMGGGKTYSQLSAASIAQPKNTALATTVNTVFKGETLRSMLLNA